MNRLEGRPRSVDFGRSLRAEVRDALWMLSRQWQLGEFNGDDAGSPVLTTFQLSRTTVDGYRPKEGGVESIDESVPLETVVERRSLAASFEAGGLAMIDLRTVLGRRFLKMIPGVYHEAFITQYGFTAPDASAAADTERAARSRPTGRRSR